MHSNAPDESDSAPPRPGASTVFSRVVVLKPNRLYSEVLGSLLRTVLIGAEIVIACCIADAATLLAAKPADLLVADVATADGDVLDSLSGWKARRQVDRTLVMTSYTHPHVLDLLHAASLEGILDEMGEGPGALQSALSGVQSGGRYRSETIARGIQEHCVRPDAIGRRLTATEKIVLAVIGDGSDDRAAARELGLSESTVQSVRRDLHRKLHLQHKGELVQLAEVQGYIINAPFGRIRPGFAALLRERNARRSSSHPFPSQPGADAA